MEFFLGVPAGILGMYGAVSREAAPGYGRRGSPVCWHMKWILPGSLVSQSPGLRGNGRRECPRNR